MKLSKLEKYLGYHQTMLVVVEILKQGIIDKDDYIKIEKYLAGKYSLNEKSIFRIHYKI